MLRDALTSFLRKSRPVRRRLRRRRTDCQQLEQRCLLSATIQGRVWEDADADGLVQSSELFLSDVEVRLLTMDGTVVASTTTDEIDLDQSGTIDPATETGWYRFHPEVAGNYQVQIGGVADSSLTSPRHRHHVVTGSSHLQAIPNQSRNSMFVVGGDGVAEIHFRSRAVLNRYEVSVESPEIALSPDEQILAVAGREGSDISVTFFDLSTGEQNRLRISGPSHQFVVNRILWMHDDKMLFQLHDRATRSLTVIAYDASSQTSQRLPEGTSSWGLELSEDRRSALFSESSLFHSAMIYESATGHFRELPFLMVDPSAGFTLNSDGTLLLRKGLGPAVFAIDGTKLYTPQNNPIGFSPLNGDLITYSGGMVHRHEARTGALLSSTVTSNQLPISQLYVLDGREYLIGYARDALEMVPLLSDGPQSRMIEAVQNETAIVPSFGLHAPKLQVSSVHSYPLATEGRDEGGVYRVSLSHRPDKDVVVHVEVDQPDQVRLSTNRLTFTEQNWQFPQAVHLTPLDDELVEGRQHYQITFTGKDSDGNPISHLLPETQPLIVADNDRSIVGSLKDWHPPFSDGQTARSGFQVNLHSLSGQILDTTVTRTEDADGDGRISAEEYQRFEFPVAQPGTYLVSVEGHALHGKFFGEFDNRASHSSEAFFHPITSEPVFLHSRAVGSQDETNMAIIRDRWDQKIDTKIRFFGDIGHPGHERHTVVTAAKSGNRIDIRVASPDGTALSQRQVWLPDVTLTNVVTVSSDTVWLFVSTREGRRQAYSVNLQGTERQPPTVTDLKQIDFVAVSRGGVLLLNALVEGAEHPVLFDPARNQILATGPYGHVATAMSENGSLLVSTDKTGKTVLFDENFQLVRHLGKAYGGAAFDQNQKLHVFDSQTQTKRVLDLRQLQYQDDLSVPLILPSIPQKWQIAPDESAMIVFLGDRHRYIPMDPTESTHQYQSVRVTDDTAEFAVDLPSSQTHLVTSKFDQVIAEGTTGKVRIALAARPENEVRVIPQIWSDRVDQTQTITVDQTPMIFTPDNWAQPRVVEISVLDDQFQNPLTSHELILRLEHLLDGKPVSVASEDMTFRVRDDDVELSDTNDDTIDSDDLRRQRVVDVEVEVKRRYREGTLATVSWQSRVPVEAFELQVVRLGAAPQIVISKMFWGTESTATLLLPNGRYRAWVRTVLPESIRSDETDGMVSHPSWSDRTSAWSPSTVFLRQVAPDGLRVQADPSGQTNVSWNEVEGATGYRVFIRDRVDFSKPPEVDEIVESNTASFQLPPQVIPYEVWVQAIHDGVRSRWSARERIEFWPMLRKPKQLAPDGNPDFSWIPVAGADSYDLSLSLNNYRAEIETYRVNGTSFRLTEPLPQGEYKWWVRPVPEVPTYVPASVTGFIFVSPLSFLDLSLIDPDEDAPVLKWFPSKAATHYRVYLRSWENEHTVEVEDITDTEIQLAPLPAGRYQVWVQTTLEDGSSSWGRQTTLHIPAPTSEAVASHLSVNRFASGRVNFSWIPAEGNVTYDVLLTSGLNSRMIRHHDLLSVSVDDLPPGVWSWHVRAVTEEGQRGPWVAGEPFNTDSRAVLVVPESFSAVDNVTIRWLAHVEAIRFQLQIDNLTTGQAKVIREDHLTGSRYQAKTSLTPGEYRVWVRAISADGTFAPWSRWHDFTVNQDNATSPDTTN